MPYTPTPNTVNAALIAQINYATYKLTALQPLEKKTIFPRFMKPDNIEAGRGNIACFYRPENLAEPTNPTQTVEGAVGTSLTYSSRVLQVRMLNYSDFITIGSQVSDISATNDLNDAAGRLGYYGQLAVDNLYRRIVDAEYAGMQQAVFTGRFGKRDVAAARHSLVNRSVPGMRSMGGRYAIAASPMVTYDFLHDPDAGGYLDMVKQQSGVMQVRGMEYAPDSDDAVFMDIAGCRIFETNNVTTGTNAGGTYYQTYLLGQDAFGRVDFAKRPTGVGDGTGRFNVYTERTTTPSLPDPTNSIGGFCSINFWTGAACLAMSQFNGGFGNTYRGVQWRFNSSIT